MRTFQIQLQTPAYRELITGATSFVGVDASGSFGIQSRHERMITIMSPGMARVRFSDGHVEFLGTSGGLLYFSGNQLTIDTITFVRSNDHGRLLQALQERIEAHFRALTELSESIQKIEESLLHQLMQESREKRM